MSVSTLVNACLRWLFRQSPPATPRRRRRKFRTAVVRFGDACRFVVIPSRYGTEVHTDDYSEKFQPENGGLGEDPATSSEPLDLQFLRLAKERCELEDRERRLIAEAREYGWTNGDIGQVLGVTRQAISQKVRRERTRRPGAVVLVEQVRQREEQRAIVYKLMHQMLQRR
jgi:Sigma-70, region 4